MKKILVVVIIMGIIVWLNKDVEQVVIPHEAIRFRVIGNSNSKKDQDIKKIVQGSVEKEASLILENVHTLELGREKIKSNLDQMKEIIDKTLKEYQINQAYKLSYGEHDFPEKIYNDIIYPKGSYESLVITLGDGLGDNFWCIMFPPLCSLEVEKENMEEVEYKSFVKEQIKHYFSH